MTRRAVVIAAVACVGLWTDARAAVDYLPDRDVLWVTDYPAEFPCTPRQLARADHAFGWNKVAYDAATDTCTVNCTLWIGSNDGSHTWFQVGSSQRPAETLVVKGHLRVHSTWLDSDNTGTCYSRRTRVNRLTLGLRDDPTVKARLLIDNTDRRGHTLTVGGPSGYGAKNNGGELCVFHGLIAPHGDTPIGTRTRGDQSMLMGGQKRIELVRATVRDVAGEAFGRHLAEGHFDGVRFERCGTALHGTYQKIVRDCTFSDCGTAVAGSSRFDLVLYNCVFAGNRRNWWLPRKPMVLIDCDVDDWSKGAYAAEFNPFAIAKCHVVVSVSDTDGRPVKGASVRATVDTTPPFTRFDLNHAVTGADGRTPGPGATGSLLLSQRLIQPAADAGAGPVQTTYHYTIAARAGDRVGRAVAVSPSANGEPIAVTLGGKEAANHRER